jgi:predicted RND superfamily exporter protein
MILCLLLIVPSLLGIANTRINYDMLDYLPSSMETVKGQNILLDQFDKGAFSLIVVKGMEPKDVAALKEKIAQIEHVDSVIWYNDIADVSIPMEILPTEYYNAFNSGDETLMAVFFDTSTSDDATIEAIQQVRAVTGTQCFVSGMSAMVTDLKTLAEHEEPIYVLIAVVLACAVMMLFMDSWLVPLMFLSSIGLAILYNLGTNYFLGEISFITKALSAVLQLAVTMDYSIFLWHSYCEEKGRYADHNEAMAHAINNTLRAVAGSSLTTVAGFIALCFMTYTLGFNLGIVMAKGVFLGVIGCVTTLPAMILLLDKPLEKTMHRALMPKFNRLADFIARRSWIFLIVFAILIAPAVYGYSHTQTYYELSKSLPDDMAYAIANTKLSEDFDISTTHMALVSADLSQKDTAEMIADMSAVDGVKQAIGLDSLIGPDVPEEILPNSIRNILESDEYKLLLINSEYKVASDSVNNQIDEVNTILKGYDKNAMLIGEAPVTKDMISITGHDFDVVTAISIAAVFIIIAFTLKSISLPVILVAVIEFAIFINLGIPYYTGTALPFITPICISTIQLGSTVDYAILMTTRFVKERALGHEKHQAISISISTSAPSIIVSALGFFAATFGVALYSNIDMISSMCKLMARGAIISMLSVLFVLPALFSLLDKPIRKTTFLYGMHRGNRRKSPALMAGSEEFK